MPRAAAAQRLARRLPGNVPEARVYWVWRMRECGHVDPSGFTKPVIFGAVVCI